MLKVLKSYIKLTILKFRIGKLEKTLKKISNMKSPKNLHDYYIFNYKVKVYKNKIQNLNSKLIHK